MVVVVSVVSSEQKEVMLCRAASRLDATEEEEVAEGVVGQRYSKRARLSACWVAVSRSRDEME